MSDETYDIIILNAAELVTVHNDDCKGPLTGPHMRNLGVIEDGAVAISDGKIAAVGTTSDIKSTIDINKADVIINASGQCVIPGFVDPHTHLIFAGSREFELPMKQAGATYLEILEKGGGILNTVKATRSASTDQLIDSAKTRLDRMLAFGTTTAEAKSGYGLDKPTELKSLDAIHHLNDWHLIELVPTFLGAHAIPEEYKGAPDDYIDYIISDVLPEVTAKNFAEYCDIFCEKGVFSVDNSRKLLNAAKENGLGLRIHSDEIVRLGGTELAIELGAVSASHLMKTTDAEFAGMAEHGIIAELLPATPFALMEKEYPRARAMIEAGVPVALSTDLNPNCWTESMQFVITLACYQMKMHPSEALAAATLNAAHAINRADKVGSIEVGKQADILVLDAKNHLTIPYHFGVNLIDTIIKTGEIVLGEKNLP
jgi:imidazolonepropionase